MRVGVPEGQLGAVHVAPTRQQLAETARRVRRAPFGSVQIRLSGAVDIATVLERDAETEHALRVDSVGPSPGHPGNGLQTVE